MKEMLSKLKHISKENFLKLIQERFYDYAVAIASNNSGLFLQIRQYEQFHVSELKKLDNSSKLFGTEVWGYGINSICDGNEIHHSIDVSELKKLDERNKHLSNQRFLFSDFQNRARKYLHQHILY
ncbi:MAG: hypothetical protein IPM77_15060 [Crocinitomicaceae bacterium]|nr:hypothetical protein [Crocinitomicaceae bacterium]